MKASQALLRRIAKLGLIMMTSMSAQFVQADDMQEISNIGFMENPPKELKKKFPMCDAFLRVEWIDRRKMIGYANYEAILKTKSGGLKNRRMVWALVDMTATPLISLDVTQYKKAGKLEEVVDHIRNGKRTKKPDLTIEYEGKAITFWENLNLRNYDEHYPLLSDHRQTVCVAYPDEQKVWIAEGKSVKNAYDAARRAELYKQVQEAGSRSSMTQFENRWVLDVNFDGVDDYPYGTYSYKSKLFELFEEAGVHGYKFTFPPTTRTCLVTNYMWGIITTDGRDYFLGKECNLTELTTLKEKE